MFLNWNIWLKGRMGRYWRMVGGPEGWVLEKRKEEGWRYINIYWIG